MAAWLERFAGRVGARGFVWSKEADNPVGCAVLSTQKGKTGPFTVTRTFLNASGVPGVGCEHNDVLALSEHRNAVIQDMARLIDTFETDEVELAGTRPRLLLELLPLLGGGLPWNGYESESPYVVLQEVRDSGGDYLATLSSNARAQIRRSLRQYERIFGAVELSVATTSDTALEWFGQMLEMHDRRWSAEPSGFPADARRLHADLIRENLDARAARGLRTDVLRIRFGTKTIAILYNLVFQGRVHFFQSGLSYYDDRKLKPGLVAHALAIQHYVDVGEHEYDFLGGDPAPVRYKRSMSSHRRPLVWASISVPTPKSKLINRLRLIWRRVRGIQAD
jgi:CelD/BcsL family acetyltransferase involved in cellulose biosynthesis